MNEGTINQEAAQLPSSTVEDVRALYLDLLKRIVLDLVYADQRFGGPDYSDRPGIGNVFPAVAHSMIGVDRLNNVQFCAEDVIKKGVPGDFIETGVWRGGASIFMRGVLEAYGIRDRTVWVADSFEGLPLPNPEEYPDDEGLDLTVYEELSVSLDQVKENFARYGMVEGQALAGQVKFLKGWFKDTLPTAPVERLAIMRLDGDLYESTIQAMENLYPKLSVGGYVIVDDYGIIPACKKATHDYRDAHGIDDEIHIIDGTGVFWQRSK